MPLNIQYQKLNYYKELQFSDPKEELENIMTDPNLLKTINMIEMKEKSIEILKETIIPKINIWLKEINKVIPS